MGRSEHEGGETSRHASEGLSDPSAADPTTKSQAQEMASRKSSNAGLLVLAANKLSSIAHAEGYSADASVSNTPNPEELAQSVPMTATTSSSSHHDSKEANSSSKPPVHYGTRSRNKPASARPNYAEDVEMDFEQAPPQTRNREVSSSGSPPTTSRHSPTPASSQKRAVSNSNGWSSVNNNSSIPGTSTFAANPNANAPKKRKPAASSSAAQNGNFAQSAQASSVSRRANASTQLKENSLSNMYSFENCQAKLKNGKLIADDGTVFCVNDHVYLVCEPPGDPYYIGRIMEFIHPRDENNKVLVNASVEGLRMNWVYRPRDIQRFSNDTRLVYATMHSDVCPLTSIRGKCFLSHRAEFNDLDAYRKQADHFWFQHAFDRFIHRCFDVIPTSQVVNVPENVKKALDERWKYIVVETSRARELTSAVKSCKRCSGFCATHDSVECAVCHKTYHMNCVRPPLLKKPSRGFAWACAPCSRAQERKLEARRTPVIGTDTPEVDEEEPIEEEEDEAIPQTNAPSPEAEEDRPATDAEIAHAKLWTMRYLGIHCRVEDALQYDDRAIYPRASSRIGPRHQAIVPPWYGRPVELVKPAEIKKKFVKAPGHKKDTKLSKETQAAIEADRAAKSKREKWIQDEPTGYVRRGEDHPNKDSQNTARLTIRLPEVGDTSERGQQEDKHLQPLEVIDAYMERAKRIAKQLGVSESSVDFLDRAVYLLQDNSFDADAAIKQLRKTDPVGKWPTNGDMRKDLRDPRLILTSEEKKRFEEAVAKYGSELRMVRLHVKTVFHADIVRYWYYWKKTPRGLEIWGSFSGRRNAKRLKAENEAAAKLLDDIADKYDDSAFDNDKIESQTRKMICKHCSRRHSRVWRRAPGVTPGQTVSGDAKSGNKKENLSVALCERCSRLWRRYAIKWENQEEVGKKVAQGAGRTWKKRVDEELLKEWESSARQSDYDSAEANDSTSAVQSGAEASKKRPRGAVNEQGTQDNPARKKLASTSIVTSRPPSPPPQPAMPKFRDWPCAICNSYDDTNDELLKCRDCRLVVHRKCYGQVGIRNAGAKWSCDMCSNDRKESASVVGSSMDPASYDYKCVLCPVDLTPRELVETPRVSHKKKNDRDRERERVEKEFAVQLSETYRLQQKNRGRPTLPREPLKRTADNNWVHVMCGLFIPEIKFSNAKTLDSAEGVPFALRNRKADQCIVCKTNNGAAIQCHGAGCSKKFHVACALGAEYTFGFDVIPVKSTRRDSVNIVTIGPESGMMTAAIWCKEHAASIKGIVHNLNESVDDGGLTALQLFAQNFKQADLTLTGTTRKANQLDDYTKLTIVSDNRRASTSAVTKTRGTREMSSERIDGKVKRCAICNSDSSPRWFKLDDQDFVPTRRLNEDIQMANGIKNEPNGSRESSIRADGSRTNGISHLLDLSTHAENPTPLGITIMDSVENVPQQYVCNGCRWRRRRQPSESQKMDTDPPPMHSPEASPPTNRPVQPSWGPLANIPAQPPTHGTWPTSTHFSPPVHTSPQPFVGHQPASYTSPVGHTPYGLPPAPPPQRLTHHHVLPPLDALPANGHVPPPLHPVPAGLPNGISVHSPTHPHPPVIPLPRQLDGPYSAPRAVPPAGHIPSYGHPHPSPVPPTHHGSPVAPMAPGHPLPGSVMGPAGLPSQLPGSGVRSAHGASASPNVRNLIDG